MNYAVAVELPWPSPKLSPNARTHWGVKSRAAQKARQDAKIMACSAKAWRIRGLGYGENISASITFHPPDRRARDLDNMLSSLKSSLDGIADVVGVDDSNWSISMRKAEPVKGGKVIVELEAA